MTDASYTHLCLVVDRSGSMAGIARDMDGAIKQLLQEQAKLPGHVVVDIITFDTIVEYPYTGVRPDDVKHDIIVPRGGTALNDALAGAIVSLGEKFTAMDEDDRPALVIVAVVTDGEENSSREYAGPQGTARVKEMVQLQQDQFDWEFMFLATGIDAFATAAGYGVGRGGTISFAGTQHGTQSVANAASAYMGIHRGGDRTHEFTEEDRKEAEAE